MVSLKYTPEEMIDNVSGTGPMAEPSEYPYGTCLCLTEKILDKLEADHTDWKVGEEFSLDIRVKVKSISENSAELQIIDIEPEEYEGAVEKEKENEDDLAEHGYRRTKDSDQNSAMEKHGYHRSQT